MEWVETTGKTIEEARDRALDQLGVAEDDAEIEIIEEPRAGLFGLIRGEARLRARVRPAEVRPKQDRRRGRRDARKSGDAGDSSAVTTAVADSATGNGDHDGDVPVADGVRPAGRSNGRRSGSAPTGDGSRRSSRDRPDDDRDDARDEDVEPAAVGAAAVEFMEGLVEAFGLEASVELLMDGVELDVHVHGSELGLLIGPGGRTLTAIQDLARVAAQRRLGDHATRLRIDVAGYRERRREALERFARSVADQVRDTGTPRSLEPMPSVDRKVVHDTIADIEGVTSRSEGDDPDRRVIVDPE